VNSPKVPVRSVEQSNTTDCLRVSESWSSGLRLGVEVKHLPKVLSDEFDLSRSEARRLLAQGGVSINGRKIGLDEMDIEERQLFGATLRVGRREKRLP
jgi:tyrosyl-tRNA synthetase